MARRQSLSSLPTRAMPEGDRIPGFRLIRELGTGGSSRVYLVEHGLRQRAVVLKLLRPEVAQDVELTAQLRASLQALRGVRHPHLETLLEISDDADRLWWVSEYLPGGDLRDRLRSVPDGLPVDDALRILMEIARGLSALHARGLLHRDLKPANILFDVEGRAVIADYGLVVARSDQNTPWRPSLAGGTPLYMSPEQQAGGALDGRADLYSVGCVLHELLTGQPPIFERRPACARASACECRYARLAGTLPLAATVAGQFAGQVARVSAGQHPATVNRAAGQCQFLAGSRSAARLLRGRAGALYDTHDCIATFASRVAVDGVTCLWDLCIALAVVCAVIHRRWTCRNLRLKFVRSPKP